VAPRRPRWFPWEPRRLLLAGALIATMVAVTTATAGLLEVRELSGRLDRSPRLELGPDVSAAEAGAPQNILVIGSDRRPASRLPSFSDTLMLVRLDPGRGGTALMSIPRDLEATIRIPGRAPYRRQLSAPFASGWGSRSITS
jgi:anionic cell wall polymer biosynthesis LytR-Cps2A-Psr (LCP) family protein